MVKHKGLCPSLKKSVEFDVKEIIELPTKRGIKYQVKGDFEGRTCSTFCSKAKAMELKKALGLDVMEAESEDGTGQAHQEEGVSPIENNVQPLAQGQESMEAMPVQETVSTPITNTSIGVEPIENLDLTDADALNNMATDFDKAPQMVADIEIAPSEPEGDGRSIGNIRPMNEDVPLHAESEDGTGQAHQEEGVSPIENNVQPLAQGQEPMEAMPVQETVSTPITNTSIGVEPIDNLGLDGADVIGSMTTEFDDAPEILANFQIGMMQPFGEGRSIGNNTPMNPDVPLHAEEFKAEAEIEIIDPTDNTTLPTPPPVCFVDKIPPSVWENLSVLEKIHYAETGDESILICPNCGISKEQLRLQDGFGVCDDCAYQKYFAPSHWITEPMIVANITEDEIELSERLPADVDMPSMKNPQKDLQTMIIPYFVWDKIYTQFTGGIKAEQDLSGLNYVLTYHGMMKPQLDNAIEVAEGEYDMMFGAERYQAQVFKAENNQGYYIDAETVIPLTKKGKVRTMSGKPHTPRELKEDKDITPEEALMRKEMKAETFGVHGDYPVKVFSYSVDVHKDDYEQGEVGDSVHYWRKEEDDFDFDTKAQNEEELLKILNEMIRVEVGRRVPTHKKADFGFDMDNAYTDVHATYEEGQGMGFYDYPNEHEREAWKRGKQELFSLGFTFEIEPVDESYAETFNVEFDDWADQEMLTHGKTVSFKEWAKEEGKKHGDMDLTDWAEEEEESHDERYEAENFDAEVVQYDVLKGKPNEGGVEYAEYISIHDSVNEAEKEARMESKNLDEDEAIYVVEERFDDETLESKPSNLMFSIEKPLMEDEMSDNFEAEILQKVGLIEGNYQNIPDADQISYMKLDIYPKEPNKERYVLLVRPYHISKVSEKYLNDILTSENRTFPYGSKYSWANEQNRNGLIWDDEIKSLRRMKTQEKEIFDNNEVMMKKAIKKLEKKIKKINKPNDDSQKQDIPSLKSVGLLLGLGALGAYLAPQNVRNFLNRLNK